MLIVGGLTAVSIVASLFPQVIVAAPSSWTTGGLLKAQSELVQRDKSSPLILKSVIRPQSWGGLRDVEKIFSLCVTMSLD